MDCNETAERFLSLIATDSLPSLGPDSRAGVRDGTSLIADVDSFCESENIQGQQRELLRSAALLWHDDLDGSHDISQCIKSTEGSFLHGIMHRREPDNSNAKYWFRLVGDHPCFPEIATAVTEEESANELRGTLISAGDWDPFAFVDACTRSPSSSNYPALQRIQELEFRALINSIVH